MEKMWKPFLIRSIYWEKARCILFFQKIIWITGIKINQKPPSLYHSASIPKISTFTFGYTKVVMKATYLIAPWICLIIPHHSSYPDHNIEEILFSLHKMDILKSVHLYRYQESNCHFLREHCICHIVHLRTFRICYIRKYFPCHKDRKKIDLL